VTTTGKPEDQQVTLVNVISRKGGTGKTTLGLLLATHFADRGDDHRALVLDLDFLGTQLLEGLAPLLAEHPKQVAGEDRTLASWLFEPPWTASGRELGETALGLELPRVWVAPSQTRPVDIERLFPLLEWETETHYLCGRLEQALVALVRSEGWRDAEAVTVVLDNGPGQVGLAAALPSHGWDYLRGQRPCCRYANVYVCTPDAPDVFSANLWLEELGRKEADRGRTQVVLNRVFSDDAEAQAVKDLPPWAAPLRVDHLPELQEVYVQDPDRDKLLKLARTNDSLRELAQRLGALPVLG